MKLHSTNLSGNRLAPIVLALATALALPPAFAQSGPSAPAATPPETAGAPATPMHEGTPPPSDPAAAPAVATTTAISPATFKDLDVNKDGKLSREEVANDPMWTADFDAADTNHDGYISKSEFKKHEAELKKTAKLEDTQK